MKDSLQNNHAGEQQSHLLNRFVIGDTQLADSGDMGEKHSHLLTVRNQFTRQADSYLRMKTVTDQEGLDRLVSLVEIQPVHQVLDVGCGPGFYTMTLAQRCGRAIGIDATPELLARAREEARQRGLRNLQFIEGDAEHLPFPTHAFDVVTSRAAFHHFVHPERVLAEMKRVLKPNGRVLIADMIASEDREKADYQNRLERLCDPSHTRALSQSEFDRLFNQAGLEVVLQPRLTLDYELYEWMDHAGPTPEAVQQIIRLMEASLNVDRTGLNVRRESDQIKFTYIGIPFVARPRDGVY